MPSDIRYPKALGVGSRPNPCQEPLTASHLVSRSRLDMLSANTD